MASSRASANIIFGSSHRHAASHEKWRPIAQTDVQPQSLLDTDVPYLGQYHTRTLTHDALDKSPINGTSDVFLSDRKTKTDETRLPVRLCAHAYGIASESDAAGPLGTHNTSKIL